MAFAHLHVHSEYSLLDGMSRIDEIPAYIKKLGMDSVALTDHGAMFGVVDFYKACKREGVHPVIGCEVYTAARTRFDKYPDKDRRSGHLILLAENQEGYNNLIKIDSLAYTEGLYYKPRVDKNLLGKYHKGIICLSACLAGNVQYRLMIGDYEGAKAEALELLDIFGEKNFFLEVQNHGLRDDKPVIAGLQRLSSEIGIPLVATNDSHYTRKEDAEAHDVLLAIGTNANVDADDRLTFSTKEFYLKSEDEMRALFPGMDDAIDRSAEIAERCDVKFHFHEYHIPDYEAPEGISTSDYLRKLSFEGLRKRYGEVADDEDGEYRKRLERELSVIESMGYVEYFLIVWDFIHYAKTHGIPVGPGRGSAAGSIAAYSLDITEIDPIKYNLIFERFLNSERKSMPDIDVDFDIEKRQDVIDYVKDKYGHDNVSQIITFGTLKAKMVVRDVARALGYTYAQGDAIAKAIPNALGMTIEQALRVNIELEEKYESDPDVKRIIDMSMPLEGLPRHASTHAAGVVISKKPIDEYVPVYYSESKGVATQFNMTTIEELGLLKMDFLGLRNLTVLRNALDLIERGKNQKIDFNSMEYDDPKVFEMIAEGNTQGVFQLESAGMTRFMKELKPTCFEDIIAGISLYRPGPMDSIPKYIENKKYPEHIKYIDTHLAHILDVTYGCIVYQEQVMQIVRDLAGYSYGQADIVRRAMSKKKQKEMNAEREFFVHGREPDEGSAAIKGCVANGISEEAANAIFDEMVSFAQYAFNKSHAAAYAVISYETAYLKCYYPVEFMAALMTSVIGDEKHISSYMRNCREMGIDILAPSVCRSAAEFSVEYSNDGCDAKIRYGLLGIKNVGSGIVNAIISARFKEGQFNDIYQFVNAVDANELNKKAIESLIKAGALDCIDENRALMLAVYEDAVSAAQAASRNGGRDQISLFQLDEDLQAEVAKSRNMPRVNNFNRMTLLAMEKAALGVYISGHPLDDYRNLIESNVSCMTSDIVTTFSEDNIRDEREMEVAEYMASREKRKFQDGDIVVMAGMLSGIKTLITKKGQEMCRCDLEDYGGRIGLIVFQRAFEKYRHEIRNDAIVAVKGKLSFRENGEPEMIAERITRIGEIVKFAEQGDKSKDQAVSSDASIHNPVKIRINRDIVLKAGSEDEIINNLLNIFSNYGGDRDVLIYLPGKPSKRLKKEYRITLTPNLKEELEDMLGKNNVKG